MDQWSVWQALNQLNRCNLFQIWEVRVPFNPQRSIQIDHTVGTDNVPPPPPALKANISTLMNSSAFSAIELSDDDLLHDFDLTSISPTAVDDLGLLENNGNYKNNL